MDIDKIDIRGQTIEAAMRYHGGTGRHLNHPDPRVVEYVGGLAMVRPVDTVRPVSLGI
jgi:hypothetical protein